ncbi:MAG TPA: hypothetical protein VGY56_17085 [Verrucomicrobiae bacterium]|nr:hypothetical protein [Verrucomicrobiae bacterium]
MKNITKITAALAALGLVSQAMATDPVIYLTGSTAFRSTIFNALADNTHGYPDAVFQADTVTYGTWGNSAAGSANYMVFHGTLATNGQACYIDCAWSGSEAGIASACNTTLGNSDRNGNLLPLAGSPETWVDYTTATLASGGNVQSGNPGANGSPANGAQLEASSHGSDLAQADTSQAISWTPFVANTPTALIPYGSEGVVTFTITRNVNPAPDQSWSDCTNVTLPELYQLTSGGVAPASFFTGNPNDKDAVYLVGRNRGSGTRMNYLGDSTYGAHNPVQQYSIGWGCGDPSDPAQTPTTLWLTNENNNGYESGGGVGKALADTGGSDSAGSCQQADPFGNAPSGYHWFALGYISPSDALSTGNNGGQPTPLNPNTNNWVTVDGVFSNNQNIENGAWWYWGHENLYGKAGNSGLQDLAGRGIEKAVIGQLGLTGFGVSPGGHDAAIPYSLMNVTKPSDTAFPIF